jgi:hypothetical protein
MSQRMDAKLRTPCGRGPLDSSGRVSGALPAIELVAGQPEAEPDTVRERLSFRSAPFSGYVCAHGRRTAAPRLPHLSLAPLSLT